MFHYVYIIENQLSGKKYFGVRSSKCKPEEDPYMGSSKALKSSIRRNGRKNFYKIIVKAFPSREEAYQTEDLYLKKYDLASRSDWYNLTNNTCNIKANYGWEDDAKKRFSQKLLGKGHHLHKSANVYCATTDEMIAEDVCLRDWCRKNPKYERTRLQKVARFRTYGKITPGGGCNSHKGVYAIYLSGDD